MNYLMNTDLPFQELHESQEMYDPEILQSLDVVEARYRRVRGHEDNPDICALPPAKTGIRLAESIMYMPEYLKTLDYNSLNRQEKFDVLLEIRNLRFPLPFHSDLEKAVERALVSSYSSRIGGITQHAATVMLDGSEHTINVWSEKNRKSVTISNFCMIGQTGTGKSTALGMICRKYPQAIRHQFESFGYIQIPIIRVTALPNSNISALYQSIAGELDRILDHGSFHSSQLKSRISIGRQTVIVCEWIKKYHVGLLILDEVQFLSFRSDIQNSFEQLVTAAANTGVAIGVVGNPEAVRNWNRTPRIARRFGMNPIMADLREKGEEIFSNMVIPYLWQYQIVDSRSTEVSKACIHALYECSHGNIDVLTMLFLMAQFDCMDNRGIITGRLTAERIRETAEKRFSTIVKLLDAEDQNECMLYDEMMQKMAQTIQDARDVSEENGISQDALISRKKSQILSAFELFCPEIDQEDIEKALDMMVGRDGIKFLSRDNTFIMKSIFQDVRNMEQDVESSEKQSVDSALNNMEEKLSGSMKNQ